MTPFELTVGEVVRAIPKGKTLSYGQVALFANKPGRARAVVRALRVLKGVPWWRVIKADGTVAREVAAEQSRRLRRDGLQLKGRRVLKPPPPAAPPRTKKGGR
jgi:methylated-DNA-protein-cysteine methyltransferase-like protein